MKKPPLIEHLPLFDATKVVAIFASLVGAGELVAAPLSRVNMNALPDAFRKLVASKTDKSGGENKIREKSDEADHLNTTIDNLSKIIHDDTTSEPKKVKLLQSFARSLDEFLYAKNGKKIFQDEDVYNLIRAIQIKTEELIKILGAAEVHTTQKGILDKTARALSPSESTQILTEWMKATGENKRRALGRIHAYYLKLPPPKNDGERAIANLVFSRTKGVQERIQKDNPGVDLRLLSQTADDIEVFIDTLESIKAEKKVPPTSEYLTALGGIGKQIVDNLEKITKEHPELAPKAYGLATYLGDMLDIAVFQKIGTTPETNPKIVIQTPVVKSAISTPPTVTPPASPLSDIDTYAQTLQIPLPKNDTERMILSLVKDIKGTNPSLDTYIAQMGHIWGKWQQEDIGTSYRDLFIEQFSIITNRVKEHVKNTNTQKMLIQKLQHILINNISPYISYHSEEGARRTSILLPPINNTPKDSSPLYDDEVVAIKTWYEQTGKNMTVVLPRFEALEISLNNDTHIDENYKKTLQDALKAFKTSLIQDSKEEAFFSGIIDRIKQAKIDKKDTAKLIMEGQNYIAEYTWIIDGGKRLEYLKNDVKKNDVESHIATPNRLSAEEEKIAHDALANVQNAIDSGIPPQEAVDANISDYILVLIGIGGLTLFTASIPGFLCWREIQEKHAEYIRKRNDILESFKNKVFSKTERLKDGEAHEIRQALSDALYEQYGIVIGTNEYEWTPSNLQTIGSYILKNFPKNYDNVFLEKVVAQLCTEEVN